MVAFFSDKIVFFRNVPRPLGDPDETQQALAVLSPESLQDSIRSNSEDSEIIESGALVVQTDTGFLHRVVWRHKTQICVALLGIFDSCAEILNSEILNSESESVFSCSCSAD